MFDPGRPDLLAIDDVVVAMSHRGRPQAQGICSGGRFGDPEGLETHLPAGNSGQPARLLLGTTVTQQGSHDIHLGVASRAVAAAGYSRAVGILSGKGSWTPRIANSIVRGFRLLRR